MRNISRTLTNLFLLLLFLSVAGCDSNSASANSLSGKTNNNLPVGSATIVQQERYTVDSRYIGFFHPRRQSSVGAEIAGAIVETKVRLGEFVQKGDVLVRLNADLLLVDIETFRGKIAVTDAAINLAHSDLKRNEQLAERGFVSDAKIESLNLNLKAAEARKRSITSELKGAMARLEMADIRAPYDGQITKVYLHKGVVVQPGTAIIEIIEIKKYQFHVALPEEMLGKINPGQQFTVETNSLLLDLTYQSSVNNIDQNSQTFTAIFDVPEDAPVIGLGSVGQLHFTETIEESGYWIPISALNESESGVWEVFVLSDVELSDETASVEVRPVIILHQQDERVFVRGLLKSGDEIVANGVNRIVSGQRVKRSPKSNSLASRDVN